MAALLLAWRSIHSRIVRGLSCSVGEALPIPGWGRRDLLKISPRAQWWFLGG